jgi:hypothetical protein
VLVFRGEDLQPLRNRDDTFCNVEVCISKLPRCKVFSRDNKIGFNDAWMDDDFVLKRRSVLN